MDWTALWKRSPIARVVIVDGGTGAAVEASGSDALTDLQLRATAVPVTGPLTDAELRAAAIPVSRTVSKLETTTRTPVWASGQHLVTSTSTSAKTTAITGTEFMFSTSSDGYLIVGTVATVAATKGANSMFVTKGGPYTFQLTSGQGVAFIADTAAGVASVIPVA